MLGSLSFGTADLIANDVMAFLWWNDRAVTDTVIALVPYMRNMISDLDWIAENIDTFCTADTVVFVDVGRRR